MSAVTSEKRRRRHQQRAPASTRKGGRGWILLQMIVCVAGIYICFGLWSIQQERVMTKPYITPGAPDGEGEMYPGTWITGFFQSLAAFLLALTTLLLGRVYRWYYGKPGREAARKEAGPQGLAARDSLYVALTGFTHAFGTAFAVAAMRRLPFPVVLAAKMGKMIPVMAVGFFWYGTRYDRQRVAACLLLSAGVYGFYALDGRRSGSNRGAGGSSGEVGLLLILVSLVMDGFTNATQDVMVKRLRWSGPTLMAWVNASCALWLGLGMVCMDMPLLVQLVSRHRDTPGLGLQLIQSVPWKDWSTTYTFLQRHPDCARDLLVLSAVNGLGQIFIFFTIALFGTLTLTGMTLVRKAGSVGLSIVVHGHKIRPGQAVALLVTLACVVYDSKMSIQRAAAKQKQKAAGATNDAWAHSTQQSSSTRVVGSQIPDHCSGAVTLSTVGLKGKSPGVALSIDVVSGHSGGKGSRVPGRSTASTETRRGKKTKQGKKKSAVVRRCN